MLKKMFIIGVILFFAQSCFAATAGNTSDTKTPYGAGFAKMQDSGFGPVKVSADFDWIDDRNLKCHSGVSNAELDGYWGLIKISYTFADRIEPYVKLGVSHFKVTWDQFGDDIKVKSENGLGAGVGSKILVFELPEHRVRFSINGQYLYTDPDASEVFVRDPNRTVSATEFKISEWQIAGIVSMEFPLSYDRKDSAAIYSLIPYVGCAYADSNIQTKFTYNGLNYGTGTTENKDKILFITGCDLTSPENIVLNVESRFIGESAVSGGATVKF